MAIMLDNINYKGPGINNVTFGIDPLGGDATKATNICNRKLSLYNLT